VRRLYCCFLVATIAMLTSAPSHAIGLNPIAPAREAPGAADASRDAKTKTKAAGRTGGELAKHKLSSGYSELVFLIHALQSALRTGAESGAPGFAGLAPAHAEELVPLARSLVGTYRSEVLDQATSIDREALERDPKARLPIPVATLKKFGELFGILTGLIGSCEARGVGGHLIEPSAPSPQLRAKWRRWVARTGLTADMVLRRPLPRQAYQEAAFQTMVIEADLTPRAAPSRSQASSASGDPHDPPRSNP